MIQYLIRAVANTVEVAKFEDTATPTELYTISKNTCNCPSRYSNCKHKKIMKDWISQGSTEGDIYSDDATKMGNLFS